jgi:hypothetical protein
MFQAYESYEIALLSPPSSLPGNGPSVLPLFFSFSTRSVPYKRKVGDYFFPELLVILSFYLRIRLTDHLFPSNIPTNILYALVIYLIRALYPAHLAFA